MPHDKEQVEELKRLGERIKSIRQSKGMTLQAVADAIDKERQSINRLEKGRVNPTYLYLLQVAKGLGVELGTLFLDFAPKDFSK